MLQIKTTKPTTLEIELPLFAKGSYGRYVGIYSESKAIAIQYSESHAMLNMVRPNDLWDIVEVPEMEKITELEFLHIFNEVKNSIVC